MPENGGPDERDLWGPADVGVVALLGGALFVLAVGIDATLTERATGQTSLEGWGLLRRVLLLNVLLVGTALFWLRRRYGLGLDALGWRFEGWRREVFLGALLGVLLWIGCEVLQALTGSALAEIVGADCAAEVMQEFGTAETVGRLLRDLPGGGLAVAVPVIALIVPAGEELLFRGFVFGGFRTRFGVAPAIAFSALIFAAAHFSPADILGLVFAGALLAYTYHRRGTLVAPMVAHALNNVVSMVALALSYT